MNEDEKKVEEDDSAEIENLDIIYGNQFEVAQKVIEHFEDEIKRIIALKLPLELIIERSSAIEDSVACIISSYVKNQDLIEENVLDFLFRSLSAELVIMSDQIGKLNGEAVNSFNWRSRYGIRVPIPSWDEVIFFQTIEQIQKEREHQKVAQKKKKSKK